MCTFLVGESCVCLHSSYVWKITPISQTHASVLNEIYFEYQCQVQDYEWPVLTAQLLTEQLSIFLAKNYFEISIQKIPHTIVGPFWGSFWIHSRMPNSCVHATLHPLPQLNPPFKHLCLCVMLGVLECSHICIDAINAGGMLFGIYCIN